jgi:hypothetical protein
VVISISGLYQYITRSWDNSVQQLGCGLDIQGIVVQGPGKDNRFISYPTNSAWPWGLPNLLISGYWGALSPGVELTTPPYLVPRVTISAALPLLPIRVHSMNRYNFTFTLPVHYNNPSVFLSAAGTVDPLQSLTNSADPSPKIIK